MSDLVRLRPSTENGRVPDTGSSDFDSYLLARRESLAVELRTIEDICMKRQLIKRRLCAPGKVR